jgi:HPr kinase/phosphorylase
MDKMPVSELLSAGAKHIGLRLLHGKKQVHERFITSHRIQKPGLALAGFTEYLHEGRIQILGNTEISYLWTLPPKQRKSAADNLMQHEICCFIVTKNLKLPKEFLTSVQECGIPLFKTKLLSSKAIELITDFLEERLAPETNVHGVLMDVYGIGVLIMGRSGIGKSECAVELVKRGHRLVADDIVTIKKRYDTLVGMSNDILRHHIEVRGLGILNIKDMFGVTAIRMRKKIELVIEFVDRDQVGSCDRIGLEKKFYETLDIKTPMIVLPITARRNMALIVEVAARNQLLKVMGYDSAKDFSDNLLNRMNPKRKKNSVQSGEILSFKNIPKKGEE